MPIDAKYYIHEDDKAALDALKAIPGFTPFIKAFMKTWNENQFRILNMSSRLRLSEEQLPKYHAMLIPICKSLGIEVPELYLEMNVFPNAYTYGDTKPFIVITSGLLDTLPEELIPTVLAHECGHIACHHTLYRTMGQMILSSTTLIPGLGALVSLPLKIAFAYWMRCSEFSADRAAILVDGSADKVIEMCMRFTGYNKDIKDTASKELFLKQAEEYRDLISDNMLNQTLEFMILANQSHPLTAVRAYEADQWAKSGSVANLFTYFEEEEAGKPHTMVPAGHSASWFANQGSDIMEERLKASGFTDIVSQRSTDAPAFIEEGNVVSISIDGNSDFKESDWFPANARVVLSTYIPHTMEELKAMHPGQVMVSESARGYAGKDCTAVCQELAKAGFVNIFTLRSEAGRPLFVKDGTISAITIDGRSDFEKGEWFSPSAHIRITYY